ncbi:MAG TPA: hypothetical protein ENJ68_03080 [Devosia sp.]|nr:hypothetical protein [Devosia sp.]
MTSYLLTGPALEPVTLAEAKTFLRVTDSAEDGFINTLITAARLHLEGTTGRVLISQTWRTLCDDWPTDRTLVLPVAPLISISAITIYDPDGVAVPLSVAQFQPETKVAPARIFLPTTIAGMVEPRQHNGIEIDYVAGFGPLTTDVPADLRQALMSLVAYWFEHRDAVVIAGSGSIVPAGFDALVAPYRRAGL